MYHEANNFSRGDVQRPKSNCFVVHIGSEGLVCSDNASISCIAA